MKYKIEEISNILTKLHKELEYIEVLTEYIDKTLNGLKLVGTDKCTENEKVIVIKRPFREKVFKKMIEYGWNLGDNTMQDFENVYDIHSDFIDNCYDFISKENYDFSMQNISKNGFESMIDFMSDFMRALDEVDKEV